MIDEPYRWLDAIANRREYVREQLKQGTPVLAVSFAGGILLLGVGHGQSKVFEIFDRHALAGLGHPADMEKVRQAAIDAAHLESFTRAPEDVSLRRLVGFGLGPQLKSNFEQVYSAPFLVEFIMTEVGRSPSQDLLMRVHYDGAFEVATGPVQVAAPRAESEAPAQNWIVSQLDTAGDMAGIVDLLLQAWWLLDHDPSFGEGVPPPDVRRQGWRAKTQGKVVEIALLNRSEAHAVRYEPLTLKRLGLAN